MLIVEFTLDHPILRAALRDAPEATLTWCRTDGLSDGPSAERATVVCWVDGDASAFADAVESDPTVTDFRVVTQFDARTLCRFALTDRGRADSVYPALVRTDCVVRSLTATADGWTFELAFPSHRAFETLREELAGMGFALALRRVFDEREDAGAVNSLTDQQREILLAAVRRGYLEVPRETTLSELAADLGISPNAASERFRRAVRNLVCESPALDAEATALKRA